MHSLILYASTLVGGARLVRLLNELEATRTELATTAVGEERVRVSRDLHDLLGQSLSAISLKGDLALRLLAKDTAAAHSEIESLTGVARDALRDVRAITRDEHSVSLRTEIDGAAALLGAAGVDTRLDVADLPSLSGPARNALAWAIREGTTNLLRHSDARTCAITLTHHQGTVRLKIVNDGARPPSAPGLTEAADLTPAPPGTGLSGLAERTRAACGTWLTTAHDGLSAAEQLSDRLPACRTLVLTGLSQPGNLLRALKVHVRGFIVKDAPAHTLTNGIRRMARGERVIDPELAAALETGSSPLTPRETEVLRAAATGVRVAQIAADLSLSQATVRNYLSNAISKVGARNRIDAIRISRDAGWL